MSEATDEHFLRAWAEKADESAFRSLVGRYAGFVHGAALRRTRDAGLAEEITQDVFARLAQKAAHLAGHPALSGWLHRSAMLFALERLRRRARHEKRLEEFSKMNPDNAQNPLDAAIPHLDAALDTLGPRDREVLFLHYMQKQSFPEIATRLGGTADATRMRATRALSALSDLMRKRGVTLSTTTLAAGLSGTLAQAAPASLAIIPAALGAGKVSALSIIIHAVQTMKLAKAAAFTALALVLATPLIFQQQQIAAAEARIAEMQKSRAPDLISQERKKPDELAATTKASHGIDIKQLGEDALNLRDSGRRRIRAALSRLDANNLVGLIETVRDGGLLPAQREGLLHVLLQELQLRDTALFFSYASKLQPLGSLSVDEIEDAFRGWAEVDPKAAAEWSSTNREICKALPLDDLKVEILTAVGLLTSDPTRACAMLEKMSMKRCESVLNELQELDREEQSTALLPWALKLQDVVKRREILMWTIRAAYGSTELRKDNSLQTEWARVRGFNLTEGETVWIGTRLLNMFGNSEEGTHSAHIEWVEKNIPSARQSYVKGTLHRWFSPENALAILSKQLDEFPDDEVIAGYVESDDISGPVHIFNMDEHAQACAETAFKLATRTSDPLRRIDLLLKAWMEFKEKMNFFKQADPEQELLNRPELSPTDRVMLLERIEKLPKEPR